MFPRGMRVPLCLSLLLAGWLSAGEFHPPAATPEGYAVPQPGRKFTFPRDHGSHPEFKVEWWYVTGHLEAPGGRRFGFQATFFRQAQTPPGASGDHPGPAHIHMAHMALLDVEGKRFLHQERLAREGWDTTASTSDLEVRNGPWSLRRGENDRLELAGGVRAEALWNLSLAPAKPLVVFGEDGVSRKSESPTASSHYLTWPRLEVSGSLEWEGKSLPVTGLAWMDHEISSNQLSEGQAGWDWASLQLRDGSEIMVYRLRDKAGKADPFSSLTWVDPRGGTRSVKAEGFTWQSGRHWKSPTTGGDYPVENTVTAVNPATGRKETYRLRPLQDSQELEGRVGGIPYWEGACEVLDAEGNSVGNAFVELTGYAADLGRRL